MLWSYVQLDDGTQFAYSETRDDGTVRVAVERPVDLGSDHAECFLPAVNWFNVEGFSTDDLDFLTEFVRSNAPFIFELAERQKPDRRFRRWPPDALLLNGKYPMISPSDISTVASRVLAQYDVSEAYLFGSFARGEQTPDSDIDLRLVCGNTMTFGTLYELSHELERELRRKVDIVTNPPEHMRPAFRKSIEQDEVRVYEAL